MIRQSSIVLAITVVEGVRILPLMHRRSFAFSRRMFFASYQENTADQRTKCQPGDL
jgi:hypothetical protein